MAPSTDLWNAAAVSLSEEDKLSIDFSRDNKHAILQDILATAEIKRQTCMKKRWKYKRRNGDVIILRDVCEKLANWVRKFKEIGDVAVQYDPGHAALPWAAVRFLLQLSINDVQTFGAIAESLETCSMSIARCSIIELLYLRESSMARKDLEDALVRLYAAILTLLSKALSYYGQSSLHRTGRSILQTSEDPTDEYLRTIIDKQSTVHHLCQLIDSERQRSILETGTNLHGAVDSVEMAVQSLSISLTDEHAGIYQKLQLILSSLEQPLQRIVDNYAEAHDNLARNQRLEVLRWMSTVPYRQHHNASISNVLDHSGAWLQDNPYFIEWRKSSSSAILWLHGIPGCGKTKLMSIVIQNLLREMNTNSAPVAYFYCARDASEPQRADPEEVLRAIVKQLSCQDSTRPLREPVLIEYQKRKLDAEEDGLEPSKLSATYCIDLILALTDQTPATLVIDALDECEPTRRYELLNALHTIIDESPSVIKILVSSRDDADLVSRLRRFPNIQISERDNGEDIQRFIHTEVHQAIQNRRLLNGRVAPPLKDRIVNKLVSGANGMFRWASLQIQNLCDPQRMKLASDVEAALDRLPETLAELYGLILEQIQRTEPEGRSVAENALKWLLCAQVSLSTKQMIELVPATSKLLFSEAGPMLEAADILSLCCNLVVLDMELDCFRFAHVSVRDFLESRVGFDSDTIHMMAVRKCLDIYDIDPLDHQQTVLSGFQTRPSFGYAATYWIVHYKQIDISKRKASLEDRVSCFFVSGSDLNPLFPHWMLYVRNCAFHLDPYDILMDEFSNVASSPASPLFTACIFGLSEVLGRLEVLEAFDWHQRNEFSATGAHLAARHSHTHVVEFLLRKAVDINARTISGETAMHRVAQHGHVQTAKLLLSKGAHVGAKDDEGWTALDVAVRRKDEDIISLLLQHGARAEAIEKYGEKVAAWKDDRSHRTTRFHDILGRPTGYVGILNEGQTGFLNTVLQLFYMLKPVHQIVNQPQSQTEGNSDLTTGQALQRLFATMATANDVVSARELTQSFGWGSDELNVASDPVEMLRILAEWLEMEPGGELMRQMFSSTSGRRWAGSVGRAEESFFIAINALGKRHLHEGILESDKDGKSLALPPIYIIEIRRYYYDIQTKRFEKLHSYYEFPTTLAFDADLELDVHCSSPLRYKLHGVMVHRGGTTGGKSFIFLKPRKDGRWLKFRNDHVSYATDTEAIDDNFGSDKLPEKLSTSCTAQVLIYLQEDRLDELLQFA